MNIPQHILDAADTTAIAQLTLLERECRDQGRWDRMRECFHPDSRVRLSWFTGSGRDFVAGSIDMARRGVLAKHRLGPPLVRLAGARAVATFAGVIDIATALGGIEAQLSSHARFIYRAERRGQVCGGLPASTRYTSATSSSHRFQDSFFESQPTSSRASDLRIECCHTCSAVRATRSIPSWPETTVLRR